MDMKTDKLSIQYRQHSQQYVEFSSTYDDLPGSCNDNNIPVSLLLLPDTQLSASLLRSLFPRYNMNDSPEVVRLKQELAEAKRLARAAEDRAEEAESHLR